MGLPELLSSPIKDVFVNVKLTPRERLTLWSLVSGQTNTYEVSWSDFVEDSIVPGGLYRQIASVVVDSLGLTQQSSIAVVEANAGSWFFDATNNLLYAHTNSGNNPDTETVIYAAFNVHFSTRGNIQDDIYYEPRLGGETDFSVIDAADDIFFGDVKSIASGSMSLINGDGLFDILSKKWAWTNAPALIKFGGAGFTSGEFITVASMEISDMDPGRSFARVPLRSVQQQLQRVLPRNFFTLAEFPNMDGAKVGARKPMLFGAKSNIPPVLIDSTNAKGTFMVCDPTYGSLASGLSVFVEGVQVSGVDLEISLPGCTFTVLSSFSGDTPTIGSVLCNATAPAVTGAAYETSTDYVKFYGELSGWVYTSILGISEDSFDSVAAAALDSQNLIPHAGYLAEPASAHDLIRQIERGVLGGTYISIGGIVTPTIFVPTAGSDVSELSLIDETNFVEFIPDRVVSQLFSQVTVAYDTDPDTRNAKAVTKGDDFTKYFHLLNRSVPRLISTALKDDNDADIAAQRAVFISKNPDTEVSIRDAGLVLLQHNLYDKIRIRANRAPSLTGAWVDKVLYIKQIERRFTPVPEVVVILSDLEGLASVVGGWTNDTAQVYSSASSEEQSINGYWSDDSGFIVPSDSATKDIKVWW